MAKTYLDQLVEYPAKIIKKISEDRYCVGLLVNKKMDELTEDDYDKALESNIFDYQYVDETTQEAAAYVWVDAEVERVENMRIKDMRIYVTVACHKAFMKLDGNKFKGMTGNRKDNIVRFLDRLLNNNSQFGIGTLKLESVKAVSPINEFTIREITYKVSDFNIVELDNEA